MARHGRSSERGWLLQVPRFLLIAVILASLALGLWGFVIYSETPQFHQYWDTEPLDLLYYTLQLFVGASGPVGGEVDMAQVPWQLNIARLLAPASAVIGGIIALLALFDGQLKHAMKRNQRGHVVIVGNTPDATIIEDALNKENAEVTRAESGSAEDLLEAGVRGAAAVYICNDDTGDPGENLRIASVAQGIAPRSPNRKIAVALSDPDLAPALLARHVTNPDHNFDLFSLTNLAASRLAAYAMKRPDIHSIWLLGAGRLRDETIFELVQEWSIRYGANDRLEMVVCGEDVKDAQDAINRACARMPKSMLDIVKLKAVSDVSKLQTPDITIVCGKTDAESLELALSTPQAWRGTPGSLIVLVTHGDQAAALFGTEGVGPLSGNNRALDVVTIASLIKDSNGGILVHEPVGDRLEHVAYRTATRHYNANLPDSGTPALAWEQLSQADQDASHAGTTDLRTLLASLDKSGWKVVPFGASAGLQLTPDQVNYLAKNYYDQNNSKVGTSDNTQWELAVGQITMLPETLAQMGLGIADVRQGDISLLTSATPLITSATPLATTATPLPTSATPKSTAKPAELTTHATPKVVTHATPTVSTHATPKVISGSET